MISPSLYAKPIHLASIFSLVLAIIFTTLILVGCSSSAPVVRNIYIVSTSYTTSKNASFIGGEVADLVSNDTTGGFQMKEIRTAYRNLCVIGNSSTICGTVATSTRGGNIPALTHDPLDLLDLADLMINKITFSTPFWAALACISIALLVELPNALSLPMLPRPPLLTRKLAAGAAAMGCVLLLGSMVLHRVTVSAIVELVERLTMGAVQTHVGNAVPGFGWAAFAMMVLSSTSLGALVLAEMAVLAAKAKAEMCAERGLGKVGLDTDMLRGFKENAHHVTSENSSDSKGFSTPKPAVLNMAANLYRKGMEARGK